MAEAAPCVLVVDDEPFYREAIRDALSEASIACETAASGEEALRSAEDPSIGVVVLDIGLDGMGGIELLRRLREARPALRVIVLSAHTDQEDVLEALRQRAADYLAKPLHDEELVLAVRRGLEGFAIESSWAALRARLQRLEARMTELARQEVEGADRIAQLGARVTAALSDVLGASKTSLMLVDESGSELRVAAASGCELAPEEMDAVAVGEGVSGVAFAAGESFVVDDVDADPRFLGREVRDRYRSRSLAIARVGGADGLRGVLCATDRDGEAPFGAEELSLLRILAAQVSPLLAGAVSGKDLPGREQTPGDDATQRDPFSTGPLPRHDDAELARSICDALTLEIEPERLFDAALRPVARTLPASPVALYLIENESGELVREGQCEGRGGSDRPRLPRSLGLTATVLQTGRLVATDHPESDPRFDPAVDTPEDGGVAPLLCVPLQLRGKVLGVLRAFPEDSVGASARTGEVLSAVLSAAVRNVLLYRSLLESIEEVAQARREAQGRV
jgi:DNA-binding response OmpR family regulator